MITTRISVVLIISAFLYLLPVYSKGFVSFDQGMNNFSQYYTSNLSRTDNQWGLVKKLYETVMIKKMVKSIEPIIPKIIHQIWLGSPLPEKCWLFVQTWLKFHPDWEYKLWQEEDIEKFGLQNKLLYDAATNYGEKSDIARYEILYRIGGLYIDTDFECLQPFDLFHHICDFYTGLSAGASRRASLLNGLIGAAPLHPILKECIDTISRPNGAKNDSASIMNRTGPHHFTNCFFKIIKDCSKRVLPLPANYFYPWPHYHRFENKPEQISKWIKPESFAIHHWHVSWNK